MRKYKKNEMITLIIYLIIESLFKEDAYLCQSAVWTSTKYTCKNKTLQTSIAKWELGSLA